MPMYSGFSTRQQEQNYNRLIEGTLRILAGRILKFYEQFAEDDNLFLQLLSKNVSFLALIEQTKSQPPKFSESLKEICQFLKIQVPANSIQTLNQGSNNRRPREYQRNKELTVLTRNNSAFNRSKQDSPSFQSRQVMRTLENDKSPSRRVSSPSIKNSVSVSIQGGSALRQRNTSSPQPKGGKFTQQIIQKNNKQEFQGNEDQKRRSFRGNPIQSVRQRAISTSVNVRETLKYDQRDSKQGGNQFSAFSTIDASNKESVSIAKDVKQVDATSSQIQKKLQDRFGMRDQIKQINKIPLSRMPNSVRSSPTSRETDVQYPQIVKPQVNSYVISSQNQNQSELPPYNLDNLQISIKTYSIHNNIS